MASRAGPSSIKQSKSPEAVRQSTKRAPRRAAHHASVEEESSDTQNGAELGRNSNGDIRSQPEGIAAPPSIPQNLADEGEDDDPVTSEYSVYISPEISWNHSMPITIPDDNDDDDQAPMRPPRSDLLLLQFPTRTRMAPYNSEDTPLALRMKPRNGFLELDVPLHRGSNYDTAKAKQWGRAMRATGTGGGRGSFGMANGFMSNPAPRRGGAEQMEEVDESDGEELNCQTLGGMLSTPAKGLPRYMAGTFRGAELHLTPVTGMAQLRPQHHHLDAASHQARGTARTSAADTAPSRGAAGPRMLAISHKQPPPGGGGGGGGRVENAGTANVKELLLAAAEEEWSELDYFEEEHANSYEAFKKYTFLSGAQREQLRAEWDSDQYLDRIGGGSDRAKAGTAALRKDRKRRGKAAERKAAATAAAAAVATAANDEGGDDAAVAMSSGTDDESGGETRADETEVARSMS